MGDITDIVVLRLTRAEAEALDDLAHGAMDRLAGDRKLLAAYARMDGDLHTLARACDKLRQAALDEPNTLRWTNLIKQVPDKSRTLLGEHDGLSAEAAFERYAQRPGSILEAEREGVAKRHEPDIALQTWGPLLEESFWTEKQGGGNE